LMPLDGDLFFRQHFAALGRFLKARKPLLGHDQN
jgi:hypothetical protein